VKKCLKIFSSFRIEIHTKKEFKKIFSLISRCNWFFRIFSEFYLIFLLTRGTPNDWIGMDFDALFTGSSWVKKKMICVWPFQPLAHSFKEIDFLNNYCNNLKILEVQISSVRFLCIYFKTKWMNRSIKVLSIAAYYFFLSLRQFSNSI